MRITSILCIYENIVHSTGQQWIFDPPSLAIAAAVKLDPGRKRSLSPLVMNCTFFSVYCTIHIIIFKIMYLINVQYLLNSLTNYYKPEMRSTPFGWERL